MSVQIVANLIGSYWPLVGTLVGKKYTTAGIAANCKILEVIVIVHRAGAVAVLMMQ